MEKVSKNHVDTHARRAVSLSIVQAVCVQSDLEASQVKHKIAGVLVECSGGRHSSSGQRRSSIIASVRRAYLVGFEGFLQFELMRFGRVVQLLFQGVQFTFFQFEEFTEVLDNQTCVIFRCPKKATRLVHTFAEPLSIALF